MTKNYLDMLTCVIYDAPLWVQEVIFLDIKNNLEKKMPGFRSSESDNEIYTVYKPELTFKGKKELETHDHNLDFNVYRFMDNLEKDLRIIDITLNNFWTLEQTSEYFAFCIKNELVKNPSNPVLSASVFYLGNEIRLGEYIKRIDKISVSELDDVLRKQKTHNEENPNAKLKIGELLIHMGYIANNDIDKIINLKEEAQRRFLLSTEMKTPAKNDNINYDELQQKIQKLTSENNLLKDKLRAIFNIQTKKKNV